MSRPSMLDSKYSGLSTNELKRQYDRDVMMWEQTEALKKANDLKKKELYGDTPLTPEEEALYGSNWFVAWICIFVFGGLIIGINYTTDLQIKLPGDKIPLYIYIGLLVGIPVLAILSNIFKPKRNNKQETKNQTVSTEKDIEKIEDEIDSIADDIEIEKVKLKALESKLSTSVYSSTEFDEEALKKEIKDVRTKINRLEKKQIKLEEQL